MWQVVSGRYYGGWWWELMVKLIGLLAIESSWISSGLRYNNLDSKIYSELIDTKLPLDQPGTRMREIDCV